MPTELQRIIAEQGKVVTAVQLREHLSRRAVQRQLRTGELVRIWPGIYCQGEPSQPTLLRGLDLRCGEAVVICLGTAAATYGFDTQGVSGTHILHPGTCRLRDEPGLVVHRRDGAPITTFGGRPITAPGWTAVEVARGLRRPRALATLDAALRSGTCDRRDLRLASVAQAGRRGIVQVRELIPLARPEAESPMESESRLVMIDRGLPEPELQYEIIDREGNRWRVDFAWPEQRVAVEFDGFDFHSSPEHLLRDRKKRAALQEMNWRVLSIVSDDVRRNQLQMVRRIRAQLDYVAA